ncbi:MAG: type III pantothenate kinase [Luteimonas sp.]
MKTWLFDLGNTRLKFAPLAEDGRIGVVQGTAHVEGGFDPEWLEALPAHIDVAIVASVASPALRMILLDALAARGAQVQLAHTLPALAGLTITYADPSRLGVDRFLALLSAQADGAPTLVVGVGTALTVDLIDGNGHHLGGRIAPSPTLMREALHRRVAQLAPSGGAYVEFADDTDDALVSGCEGAALGLVERSLMEATVRLGTRPRLLLHGGGGEALRARLPDAQWRADLVLHGLARWQRASAGIAPQEG